MDLQQYSIRYCAARKKQGGPDAKLKVNEKYVFCEVTAMNISKGMEKLYLMEGAIKKNISEIEPKYHIEITTPRPLTDCDVMQLSEFIKQEIIKNHEKNHFTTYCNDITLVFADNFSHYIHITPISPLEKISSSTIDIKGKLCKTILEKICQLNKAGDNAKVLVLDYGRYFDSLELEHWYIDGFIQDILGKVVPLGNNILRFSSLPLKDLSALIVVPHTLDRNYPPSCYINDCADFIINENEVSAVACI